MRSATAPLRALLLADTHTPAHRVDELVARLRSELARADVILHAGDVTHADVLDALREFAVVHAVRGNNDHSLALPPRLVVRIGGCDVALVHDSGSASGRTARLRAWFPHADVVVFGHSHLPWHVTDVDPDGDVQHHVNPGSPTQRRHAPHCTVAWLRVGGGRVLGVEHAVVPSRAATSDQGTSSSSSSR